MENNSNLILDTLLEIIFMRSSEVKIKSGIVKLDHPKGKIYKKIELIQIRIALHSNVRITISQRMGITVFHSYNLCFHNHSLRPL